MIRVFPGGASGKNPACNARDLRDVGLKKKKKKRRGLDPWVGNILWRRAWQCAPVCLCL